MPAPDADRRRAAALSGYRGDRTVAVAALDDPEPTVRIAALRSAARLGVADDDRLLSALDDPEPTVRIAALEIAAARPTPAIAHLLDDPDPAVVETAAWACGERPDPPFDTIARLASLAVTHDDALVRESAVAALGAIGDPAGLAAVLGAMSDKPAVRRRAVVALAAFEGPAVDAAWAAARRDRDRQVREAVDELLGPLQDAEQG